MSAVSAYVLYDLRVAAAAAATVVCDDCPVQPERDAVVENSLVEPVSRAAAKVAHSNDGLEFLKKIYIEKEFTWNCRKLTMMTGCFKAF